MPPAPGAPALRVHPLTPQRWPDLERLFGPSGGYSNCWCAYQRVTGAEFSAGCAERGAGNRALLRRLTLDGRVPGLLAYLEGEPVGWVSVGPRTEFGRILRSPIARLDRAQAADAATWSIVCFYVPRTHRGRGLGAALLAAAVDRAREHGAAWVEGYPVDTGGRRVAAASAFTGTLELFRDAGFRRVAEHRPGRPLVRLSLP